MNQKISELFEKLEKNPILLDSLSGAESVEMLYKKAIKIVDGYTINDLRFALEELNIIPKQDNLSKFDYVSGGSSAIDIDAFTNFFKKNQ